MIDLSLPNEIEVNVIARLETLKEYGIFTCTCASPGFALLMTAIIWICKEQSIDIPPIAIQHAIELHRTRQREERQRRNGLRQRHPSAAA